MGCLEIQRGFQRSLPGLSVAMRGCWGPFEDTDGLASHFDGGANRLRACAGLGDDAADKVLKHDAERLAARMRAHTLTCV